MRAVQFDAFNADLYVADRPIPQIRPHGILIKVHATGLCRSDWHGWVGHDDDIQNFPHVPGHEFAGTIAEVGANVSKFKVGDRVTVPFVCGCGECTDCANGNAQVCMFQWQPGFSGQGSFAEYVAIPQADFNAVHIPDQMSFDTAAGLGCRFATAFRGLVQVAQVSHGETVAIFGCGGVGLAAIMIAKSRGARVVAVDKSNSALDRATLAGAEKRLDAQYDEVVKEIRKFGGNGVDITVDALGSKETSKLAVESLRRLGRHVQIGLLPPAVINDQATIPMHLVIGRELQILGSHGMSAATYPEMLDDIITGRLRPDLLVERVISLDEAPAALMAMNNGSTPGVTIIRP